MDRRGEGFKCWRNPWSARVPLDPPSQADEGVDGSWQPVPDGPQVGQYLRGISLGQVLGRSGGA